LAKPDKYRKLNDPEDLREWIAETQDWWTSKGWMEQGMLRPTADVGMLWLK
jgi:hypothetical protein